MAKNIIDLYDEYKKTYNYLKKKKEKYEQNPEKNANKIKKVEEDILIHQKKYADLWLNTLEDKHE